MREVLFVLAVVLVMLALTAFKYRRQLASLYGLIRFLNSDQAEGTIGLDVTRRAGSAGQLVKCDVCGVWVPKAMARLQENMSICSDNCFSAYRLDEHS